MPKENKQTSTTPNYLINAGYGLAIRAGTTFLYANLGDTLRTISQTENISSRQAWANATKGKGFFYGTLELHLRGMGPNLVRVGSREAFRAAMMSHMETLDLSGAGKAVLMTSLDALSSVPDTIKVLQQSNAKYRNQWVYPLSFYTKGIIPTAVRQSSRWSAVYVLNPKVDSLLESTQDTHQLAASQMKVSSGLITASVASFMVLPSDAIKSRIQNGQGTGNYLETAFNMFKQDGMKSLVRGGLPKWFITVNAIITSLILKEIITNDNDKPPTVTPQQSTTPHSRFGFFQEKTPAITSKDESELNADNERANERSRPG